ncbi:MAG TPA: WD40 repeat domain-containing protein, partial [Gemmata sp.]|nr:WD40 repeat domain-containing protein [Gemmata sp.]
TKNTSNTLGVTDVAFHPKQKLIASASGNQVHLWDPETGKLSKTLLNLGKTDKPIKPIAFSPDGKFLAVGADDGILRVVEVDTGKLTFTSPSRNARIEKLAYSPNGKMIVVGDSNSQIAIYAPGQPAPLMAVQGIDLGEVTDVAFTADSGAVFACGRDPKVRLTAGPKPDGTSAGNTATRLREFVGHNGRVNALAVIPDGSLLVTGGEDKTVRVWEVASTKQIRGFQGHQSGVTAVAVRGDGKQIASGSDDGAMRLWDLNTVDDHRAFSEANDSLWAVAYSPDGKRLAAAGSDKTIRIYNTETSKLETSLSGAKSPITSLAFFPDSNRLAAVGGDQVVVVWDVEKPKPIKELPGHESAILTVAVTDDGKRIVSGSADHTVRAFSPEVDKALWTWTGRSAVCAVAIQKGNKTIAVGLADGTLVMLDVTGPVPKEVFSQSAHVAGIACLSFSTNGERLASVGGDGALRIWSMGENGNLTQLVKFEGQAKPGVAGAFSPLTGVAFAPDSRYVATVGADSIVRIWDVETKSESRGLRGHTDWVTSVAFSPNGRFVASVGVEKDKILRVFELPPLETSASGGHLLAVNAVAVSPDGKIVATAGTDQTIKLWNILTGKEVGTLIGNADTPFAITFLGNESLVMGGSLPTRDTGRLHFWGTNPGRLAKSIATGEVYTVVSNADGSKVVAWAAPRAVGDVKNHRYELYDGKGNLLVSAPLNDAGRDTRAVTFSPDLEWAIAGDDKGNAIFWDMANKKRIGEEWPLFVSAYGDIGITPNKKYLVAVDDRGEVKVADIAKRSVLGSVTPHKAGVRTIVVSPTGTTFVTVSNDREIKSWSLDPTDLKEPKPTRTWSLPVSINGAAYTPDGKRIVTANADGTAYLLELP